MNKTYITAGIIVVIIGALFGIQKIIDNNVDTTNLLSQNGLHTHAELEIVVDGEKQVIPPNIGLIGGHNPIHTHDEEGLIHLEFEGVVKQDDTKLGNFFKVWGKSFENKTILRYEPAVGKKLTMLVNGEVNTEYEAYHMLDGDKIQLMFESPVGLSE